MAVSFDSVFSAEGQSDLSANSSPAGTPRGVVIGVLDFTTGTTTDWVDSVTYGGTALTEVSGSPVLKPAAEKLSAYGYTLDSSVPTGAQAGFVDINASANSSDRSMVGLLLQAGGNIVVQDTKVIQEDAVENPSVVLEHGGYDCFDLVIFGSGRPGVAGITPLSGWTARYERDIGGQTYGVYTKDTNTSADTTAGWTQALDDAVGIALAIREAATASVAAINASASVGARSSNTRFGKGAIKATSTMSQPLTGGGAKTTGAATIQATATVSADVYWDTYYLDATSGSDANTGRSPGNAWQTVDAVKGGSFGAGDRILFKRGDTYRDTDTSAVLTIPNSGSSGKRITVGAWGPKTDPKPILAGSRDGTDTSLWTHVTGGIWRTPALFYSAGVQPDYNTGAYKEDKNKVTDWSVNGKMNGYFLEMGPDRDDTAGWTNQGSNRWTFNASWTVSDWTPDRIIIDGTIYGTGTKKSVSTDITSLGDWGIISNTFWIYATANPDTAYDSIVVARLNTTSDDAVYHDGAGNRYYATWTSGSTAPFNPGAIHTSYLEVLDCQFVIDSNSVNHIAISDLEIRHSIQGIRVTGASSGWLIHNCDVYQTSRDGILINSSNDVVATSTNVYGAGTVWWKFPDALTSIGHGWLLSGSGDHWIKSTISNHHAEDGIQTGPSYSGTLNIKGFSSTGLYEGQLDQKGGTVICDLSDGVWDNSGGAGSQNHYVNQDNAGDITIKNGTIRNSDTASGDFIIMTTASPTLTLENLHIEKIVNTDKQIVQTSSWNGNMVITNCSIYQQGGSPIITADGSGSITSKHNAYYGAATMSVPLIQLSGGSRSFNSWNDIFVSEDVQLIDFTSGAAPAGTTIRNAIFQRRNQTTSWVDNNGTAADESDIDGGYTQGNLTIDADARTLDPGWRDESNQDFRISSSAAAATGRDTGASVSRDQRGRPFNTEVGPLAVATLAAIKASATLLAAGSEATPGNVRRRDADIITTASMGARSKNVHFAKGAVVSSASMGGQPKVITGSNPSAITATATMGARSTNIHFGNVALIEATLLVGSDTTTAPAAPTRQAVDIIATSSMRVGLRKRNLSGWYQGTRTDNEYAQGTRVLD